MSLLQELSKKEVWETFLQIKIEHNQLSKKEIKQLSSFIQGEGYLHVTDTLSFGYPQKKSISKANTTKRRIVYSYNDEETNVLKLLAYLLYKYDDVLSDACYSFRKNKTAKTAFDAIMSIEDLSSKYVLKADIHNYFNSIDVEQLIEILQSVIQDDPDLLSFLSSLLTQNKCIRNDEIIEEKRGAMAGVPLSSFFANLYLMDLDEYFVQKGIPYFRYSDDILLFFDTQEQLEESFSYIKNFLSKKKLELNPDKIIVRKPEESWEFLGFKYKDGEIDLSDMTIQKMKRKIKHKANALYAWEKKNNIPYEKTIKKMIQIFDNKFYDLTGNNAFTWIRFYFPVITTTKGLHEIDIYMQKYLRYLYSGRHYKGNYKITYEQLKKLGYTPLVGEYYNWKKENLLLQKR
ncbi:MAG: group II intron reverse transcriptase domain-containing protein [Solobacterium sp.]|nr:group II intron reverse transcriptase domain-containing protein [Solobacterium sp.]